MFVLSALIAQVKKGDWSVNGSLLIGNSFSESERYEGWEFGTSFSIARLISDHWMIGLDFEDDFYFEGPGLQARYFLNPESTRNIYFVDALGGYSFGDDETQLALSLGFNRFISENLSLEASASYTRFSQYPDAQLGVGLGIRSFISSEAYGDRKNTNSRFGKGSLLLGVGDLQMAYIDNIIRLGISLESGLFVTDRLAVGLRDYLSYARWRRQGTLNFRSWQHELAAFGRYYLRPSGGRVVPFTELGVGFRDAHTNSIDSYEINEFRWLAEARVGANVFLTPAMALEFALSGRQESRSQREAQYLNRDLFPTETFPDFDGTEMDRSFSLGFHVGLQFFLRQNN